MEANWLLYAMEETIVKIKQRVVCRPSRPVESNRFHNPLPQMSGHWLREAYKGAIFVAFCRCVDVQQDYGRPGRGRK